MPRNVRNFWITLDVDGSKKQVATGPQKADGGFTARILIRDGGDIKNDAVMIEGKVHDDGTLSIMVSTERRCDEVIVLKGSR